MFENFNKNYAWALAAVIFFCVPSVNAAWFDDVFSVDELEIGYIDSTMEPTLLEGYSIVEDSEQSGLRIGFGNRLSEKISVYGYIADAGSIEVVDQDAQKSPVEYDIVAINLKYHILPQSGILNAYGIFGVALPYAKSPLGVERERNLHADIGIGVGVRIAKQFYLRGEYEYTSKDLKTLNFSLVYRP